MYLVSQRAEFETTAVDIPPYCYCTEYIYAVHDKVESYAGHENQGPTSKLNGAQPTAAGRTSRLSALR